MRPEPLFAVRDAAASSGWYQRLLQLHAWGDPKNQHEHLGGPDRKPHENPNAGHREFWIRDPDGYVVVLAREPGA